CYSTSRRTIWTPIRSDGSSVTLPSTPAAWWRSPMTATSSTTWPAGSSSSTRGPASRTRATTARGSSRRGSASPTRNSRSRRGSGGVIGRNGAGKTTLFRLITGEEKVDAGTLRVGDTVKLAYVSQTRDTLDPTKSVWEEISGGEENIQIGARTRNARAYAASL